MNTGEAIKSLEETINNARGNLDIFNGAPAVKTQYEGYITELENLKNFLNSSPGSGKPEQFIEHTETFINVTLIDQKVSTKIDEIFTSNDPAVITQFTQLLTDQINKIKNITTQAAATAKLIQDNTTIDIAGAKKAFYDVNKDSPEINKTKVIAQLDSFIKKLPTLQVGVDLSTEMKYQNNESMEPTLENQLKNVNADVDLDDAILEIENVSQAIKTALSSYTNALINFANDPNDLDFDYNGYKITFISNAEKQEFLLEIATALNSLTKDSSGLWGLIGNSLSFAGDGAVLLAQGIFIAGCLAIALSPIIVPRILIKKISYSDYEKINGKQWSPSLSKLNMNPKKLFGLLGAVSNTEAVTGNTANHIPEYKKQIQDKMASLVSQYATNNPGIVADNLSSRMGGFDLRNNPTLTVQLHTLEQALIRADEKYVIKNTLTSDGVHLDEFFKKIDGLTPGRLELGTRLRRIPVVSPDGFTGWNKTPLTNNPGAIQSTLTIDGANESVSSLEFNHYNQITNSYNELMERRTNYQTLTNMQNQRNEISTISDFVNQINQINPLDNSQMFDDFLRRRGGALLQYYTSEGLAARFAPGVTNNIDIRDRIIRGLEERYNILRTEINAHLLPRNKINQPIGQLDRAAMGAYIQNGQIELENEFTRIAQELDATHTRLNGGLGNTMNFAGLNITDSKAVLRNHILDGAQTSHLNKLKGILEKLTR